MTPGAVVNTCYICNDKRRTADTDASITPTGPHADSETLKQTLIRALSHGHVEDTVNGGEEEARLTSGVCVVSLSSRYDGELEAVSDRVAGDQVVICRRCTSLLKDFEHHEQMAARKAEEIRRFLIRQMEVDEEEDTQESSSLFSSSQNSTKKTMARNHDERQGIIAAFRAFRKAGVRDVRGRGRKRKTDSASSGIDNAGKDNDDDGDSDYTEQTIKDENAQEQERQEQAMASARHSKRIQRRKEDGLVMRWGDALYENEDDMKLLEDEDDVFDYSPSVLLKDRSYARRGRGRKLTRTVRSTVSAAKTEDEIGYKVQCPFCFRYYTPMSSRIHNCTSYKNQLRCHACNIFFTSYVRLEKHLEVIHLKNKQLACTMDECSFTCIAEPTLTIHKHFHVLESFSRGEGKDARVAGKAEFDQRRREALLTTLKHDEVTAEDDEDEVEGSPEIADRVSFLIDEKSFLSDGHPLNITTDRISKDEEDDCKILRFQGDDRNQEKSTSPSSRLEAEILSPEKSERKSPKGHNLVLQCPICDMTLVSTRSYQEHIRDIHNLRVTTKITGEDSLSREAHKGPGAESLMRIVKYYNVKKNSNVTLKVMD